MILYVGDFDKCGGDIDEGDFAVGRFDLHSPCIREHCFKIEVIKDTDNVTLFKQPPALCGHSWMIP